MGHARDHRTAAQHPRRTTATNPHSVFMSLLNLGVNEECGGASREAGAAVLGRGRRRGRDELAGAFEVAVGATGEAKVGVVELPECGPERRFEPGVYVVRDC